MDVVVLRPAQAAAYRILPDALSVVEMGGLPHVPIVSASKGVVQPCQPLSVASVARSFMPSGKP